MLKMLALKIDKDTYPIAAGFLGGGFLAIPEADTYGGVVVINQIVAPVARPVNGRGRVLYAGGSRRHREDRSITFENTWYEEETFNAEYIVNTTSSAAPSFWEISRKPEAEIQKYYQGKVRDFSESCPCEGNCEYCHLDH